MKILFAAVIAAISLTWGWNLFNSVPPAGVNPWWLARQEMLYLSGLLSIGLMSVAMLLATRPRWLEGALGGMDRVYRAHKWVGISAVIFAALHWLVEMSSDILKSWVGRAGRVPKDEYNGLLSALRDVAEDFGEWAIYVVFAMLAISLWKRFPYKPWHFLHRAMPVLYLMLAFHAAMLAPTDYWLQPVGACLALFLIAGSYGAVRSLGGNIGKARQASGEILSVEQVATDIVHVRCKLSSAWAGHQPGQFAFVTFEAAEGAHPFTIASADQGDACISFQIKALGDFTRRLPALLKPGQSVRVEGPYGRFLPGFANRQAGQIWIAGGIGVTPFLAWLESLRGGTVPMIDADLHYCTRQGEGDPFVSRLEALCAELPGIRLHVHAADRGERLDAATMMRDMDPARLSEIWFCGPSGLADALKTGLKAEFSGRFSFHQEAFEMR